MLRELGILKPQGFWRSYWNFEHRNYRGDILWEGSDVGNLLHDEGEQAMLSAYFDTDYAGFGAPPANLHFGLRQTAVGAEADTLATITEVTGTGYARQAVSTVTGFTMSQVTGDWRATSNNVTFTNSGGTNWAAAVALFLCTVATGTAGKLLSSAALQTTRTLAPGDSLTASTYIGLSE
jgi:hypothetical protein